MAISNNNTKLAIVGLGYVGLPLAVEFARKRPVTGFDIDSRRIEALRDGLDLTLELTEDELRQVPDLKYTFDKNDLGTCNTYIVTVPTPIDAHKNPDLTPLLNASELLGSVLKKGDLVIYESTVYPGATEDDCVPVLERVSGLKFNQDFFVGYSPERINPGDVQRRLVDIIKVTSGSTPEIADRVDALYNEIITAGTHRAESIRVAEASKVIENTQRDINIALVNELAMIFNRMGIDTESVLKAAGTKWNFLPFRPGLTGGHCICVDPYYLTHKAESTGYYPQVILAGRRVNDEMGSYVASQLIKALIHRKIQVDGARVLIMGLTFKENCPDLRNTKVIDIIKELREFNVQVDVFDPWVDAAETAQKLAITTLADPAPDTYDAILLAVAHRQFREMGAAKIRSLGKSDHVLYDLKYILDREEADIRL